MPTSIETGLTGDSVYLWTGPMFHASGWCFPWAVTAVAGTHVCLRKIDYDLIWDLIERYGVTHYHGAPTVYLGMVTHPKAHRLDRPMTLIVAARAALADAARPAARPQLPSPPHLWLDRDLRPGHHLRMAPRVGRVP